MLDLERAISEAQQSFEQRREDFSSAEYAVQIAGAKLGPVVRTIKEADDRRGVKLAVLSEFANASAEVCDAARDVRQVQRRAVEQEIRTFEEAESSLTARREGVKKSLDDIRGIATRIEDHLPESRRTELPDLSIALAEIKDIVGQLIRKLTAAGAKLMELRKQCDELFDTVRSAFLAESFRQLEPQLSENLRWYVTRTASVERTLLQTRLSERMDVVQKERRAADGDGGNAGNSAFCHNLQ